MFNVRNVSLGDKRELCKIVVVATVIYGLETCGLSLIERYKPDVVETKCLRCMCGGTSN